MEGAVWNMHRNRNRRAAANEMEQCTECVNLHQRARQISERMMLSAVSNHTTGVCCASFRGRPPWFRLAIAAQPWAAAFSWPI
eukprot:780594-Amphidinium_carterae.4